MSESQAQIDAEHLIHRAGPGLAAALEDATLAAAAWSDERKKAALELVRNGMGARKGRDILRACVVAACLAPQELRVAADEPATAEPSMELAGAVQHCTRPAAAPAPFGPPWVERMRLQLEREKPDSAIYMLVTVSEGKRQAFHMVTNGDRDTARAIAEGVIKVVGERHKSS